jgi:hypothetical protein
VTDGGGLPEELRELIAAERSAPVGVSRAAVRAKLAASVGAAPLGAGAAGATVLGGGAKVLAVLALIVGAGTVVAVKHGDAAEERPAAAAAAPSPSPSPSPIPSPSPSPSPSLSPSPSPCSASASASASASRKLLAVRRPPLAVQPEPQLLADPPQPQLPLLPPAVIAPSQADLLRRAWAAAPADALDLVAQDARLHPDGTLSEERDALRINLLAKLHRLDEARAAATSFLAIHPESVHRSMIERAIQPEPSP